MLFTCNYTTFLSIPMIPTNRIDIKTALIPTQEQRQNCSFDQTIKSKNIDKLYINYIKELEKVFDKQSWHDKTVNRSTVHLFLERYHSYSPSPKDTKFIASRGYNSSVVASIEMIRNLESCLRDPSLSSKGSEVLTNWIVSEQQMLQMNVVIDGMRIKNKKLQSYMQNPQKYSKQLKNLQLKSNDGEILLLANDVAAHVRNLSTGKSFKVPAGYNTHETRVKIIKNADASYDVFHFNSQFSHYSVVIGISGEKITSTDFWQQLITDKISSNEMSKSLESLGDWKTIDDIASKKAQITNSCSMQAIVAEFKHTFLSGYSSSQEGLAQYKLIKALQAKYAVIEVRRLDRRIIPMLRNVAEKRQRYLVWNNRLQPDSAFLEISKTAYFKGLRMISPEFDLLSLEKELEGTSPLMLISTLDRAFSAYARKMSKLGLEAVIKKSDLALLDAPIAAKLHIERRNMDANFETALAKAKKIKTSKFKTAFSSLLSRKEDAVVSYTGYVEQFARVHTPLELREKLKQLKALNMLTIDDLNLLILSAESSLNIDNLGIYLRFAKNEFSVEKDSLLGIKIRIIEAGDRAGVLKELSQENVPAGFKFYLLTEKDISTITMRLAEIFNLKLDISVKQELMKELTSFVLHSPIFKEKSAALSYVKGIFTDFSPTRVLRVLEEQIFLSEAYTKEIAAAILKISDVEGSLKRFCQMHVNLNSINKIMPLFLEEYSKNDDMNKRVLSIVKALIRESRYGQITDLWDCLLSNRELECFSAALGYYSKHHAPEAQAYLILNRRYLRNFKELLEVAVISNVFKSSEELDKFLLDSARERPLSRDEAHSVLTEQKHSSSWQYIPGIAMHLKVIAGI